MLERIAMIALRSRIRRSRTIVGAISVATVVTAIACRPSSSSDGVAPVASLSAAPSGSVVAASGGTPLAPSAIAAANNPSHLPVYVGRTGAVEGQVKVTGLPSPANPSPPPPPSEKCAEARGMYLNLFRAGPDGALADAIVGVTGYEAYVPPKGEAKLVHIKGCAFEARTVTMTFGQRLEVVNGDGEAYLPHLNGARNPALMVAMPKGDPVRIYPPEPGRYLLSDDIKHPWMQADVYAFKYATHGVTGVDGRYRIEGIPEGKVTVSVRHPGIPQAMERTVEIRPGETLSNIDFVVPNLAPKPPPSGAEKVPDLR